MSDQIKDLFNKAELIGLLSEVEIREEEQITTDENQKSIKRNTISVNGVVQYGEDPNESRKFKCFVSDKKKDGTENKLYASTKEFFSKYANKTIAKVGKDEAVAVSFSGSLEPNIYYSEQAQKVIESNATSMKFFNIKQPTDENGAYVTIEGYIKSITDEMKNEEETGRLKVSIVSVNFFGDAVVIDNIIVPKELADDFRDLFEVGVTSQFYLQYSCHVERVEKKGGLGVQRSADKVYTELVLTGADSPYSEEKGVSKDAIKILLAERQVKIDTVTSKADGSKKSGGSALNSKTTATGTKKSVSDSDMLF